MIRLTVELVPHGVEEDKTEISVLEIANTGISSKLTREYKYFYKGFWLDTDGSKHNISKSSVWHDRKNIVWFLIYKVIIKVIKPFNYIY